MSSFSFVIEFKHFATVKRPMVSIRPSIFDSGVCRMTRLNPRDRIVRQRFEEEGAGQGYCFGNALVGTSRLKKFSYSTSSECGRGRKRWGSSTRTRPWWRQSRLSSPVAESLRFISRLSPSAFSDDSSSTFFAGKQAAVTPEVEWERHVSKVIGIRRKGVGLRFTSSKRS